MPSFSTTVPHSLGKEAAKAKLGTFVARLKEKYPDQVSEVTNDWQGDALKFGFASYGIKITGTLIVEETLVKVDGEIPFAAMIFKGKIVDSVQQGLEKALAYRRPE